MPSSEQHLIRKSGSGNVERRESRMNASELADAYLRANLVTRGLFHSRKFLRWRRALLGFSEHTAELMNEPTQLASPDLNCLLDQNLFIFSVLISSFSVFLFINLFKKTDKEHRVCPQMSARQQMQIKGCFPGWPERWHQAVSHGPGQGGLWQKLLCGWWCLWGWGCEELWLQSPQPLQPCCPEPLTGLQQPFSTAPGERTALKQWKSKK